MPRVKVYGAGSIGNHLANASRRLGWSVTVCDIDERALRRMKHEIYPARYGHWDEDIELVTSADVPRGSFDVILIGTPPESHIPLALDAIDEDPRAILVEKPLCPPDLKGAAALAARAADADVLAFVGYNHVVSDAIRRLEALLEAGAVGEVETIDVDWREHWGGIMAAHPWLRSPADTYLGSWQRGGGASGEHSHGVNLWQHLAHIVGAGRVTEVVAMLDYRVAGGHEYDALCALTLRTEFGLTGRVAQDVVGRPPRKTARVQGTAGAVTWIGNYDERGDAVLCERPGEADELVVLEKSRPDDFIRELEHLQERLHAPELSSPIALERALDTMLVLAAGHRAEREGQRITIDYGRGHSLDALSGRNEQPARGTRGSTER